MKKENEKTDILQIAKKFITSLENRRSAEDLTKFYHPAVMQTEYPNAVAKDIINRNLDELKKASEKGKKILLKEKYEFLKSYMYGNTVILEVIWKETLAAPVGNIPAGGEMKAYSAQFYEFEGDKIIKQRNYDCFEPFL